jgi:TetR/AcrR family transcriptional regulator, mexJK operon transcriptional repressor
MARNARKDGDVGQHAAIQRERLLDAAADVFLEHGFGITTVDLIAAHAKASKKTLYSYFSSKEEIFVATVERLCERTLAPLHELETESDDPETLLTEFGCRLLAQVLTPQAVALHRIAISEATRFPELAQLFYWTGPATVQRILVGRLKTLRHAGRVQFDDAEFIASQFIQMVQAEAQRKCAMAIGAPPTPNEARQHSARAAKLLLRALA